MPYLVSVVYSKLQDPAMFETLGEAREYREKILETIEETGNNPYRINISKLIEGSLLTAKYQTGPYTLDGEILTEELENLGEELSEEKTEDKPENNPEVTE